MRDRTLRQQYAGLHPRAISPPHHPGAAVPGYTQAAPPAGEPKSRSHRRPTGNKPVTVPVDEPV